jgi:hypothetical protein
MRAWSELGGLIEPRQVFREGLAKRLGLGALGEHHAGHPRPLAGRVEDLFPGRPALAVVAFLPLIGDRRELGPVGDTGDRAPGLAALVAHVDLDHGALDPERIDRPLQFCVIREVRLVLVGPVAQAAGGDGAQAVDPGDDRHAPLVGLVLVEHERRNLAAERVQSGALRHGDEQVELGRVAVGGDRAADQLQLTAGEVG